MSDSGRRVPAWKVLGILLGAVFVVALASWIWIKSIEARKVDQMRLRLDELRAGWGRCEARSRVPRGEVVPGEAWGDYANAVTSGRMTPDGEKVLWAFVVDESAAGLEAAREAVQAHVKAFDLAAQGARRASIGPWGRFPPARIGVNSHFSHLSLLCVARARLLAADGYPRKAAEPLLDFTRMMLDFVEGNPDRQVVAWLELAIPLHDLKQMAASAPMSPDELASLERELAVLDQGFPCYLPQLPQVLLEIGESLRDPGATYESLTGGKEGSLVSARFAWSPALMKADAFFTFDRAARKVLALHEGEYGAVRRAYEDIWNSAEASRNPLVRHFRLVNRWHDANSRERHAQIRLARAAAKYRASGEVVALADPWGTTIQHEVVAGKMRFWSVGTDTPMNPRPGGWKMAKDADYLRVEVPR